MERLKTGIELTEKIEVINFFLASTLATGGMPVYATPVLVGHMEQVSQHLAAQYLNKGQNTVGTEVCIKHLKAAKLGEVISITSKLTKIEDRTLHFEIYALNQQEEVIGTSSHTRFVIEEDRFKAKLL